MYFLVGLFGTILHLRVSVIFGNGLGLTAYRSMCTPSFTFYSAISSKVSTSYIVNSKAKTCMGFLSLAFSPEIIFFFNFVQHEGMGRFTNLEELILKM